jgi:hypothetical protein
LISSDIYLSPIGFIKVVVNLGASALLVSAAPRTTPRERDARAYIIPEAILIVPNMQPCPMPWQVAGSQFVDGWRRGKAAGGHPTLQAIIVSTWRMVTASSAQRNAS